MSGGLALEVKRGVSALTALARSVPIGECQGRRIVLVRDQDAIGVFEPHAERLVVFDFPVLVALGSIEPAKEADQAGENGQQTQSIAPPSHL